MTTPKSISSLDKKPENIVWIEQVLFDNIEENGGTLAADKSQQQQHFSTTSSKKTLNSEASNQGTSAIEPSSPSLKTSGSQNYTIGISEIELKDESFLGDERIHSLSRIVTGKIKYYVESKDDNEEERCTYWLIKLPNLNNPQRQLSQMIDAPRREISFYNEILPSIKEWLKLHPPTNPIEFQVPTCFYGKFDRPNDEDPDLDIITHILDSESLLVLDDLRASGYGKRHFGSGLLLSEAIAVIDEIAKFHATTWAMQEMDKKRLTNRWTQLFDWKQMANLYTSLIETCYSSLHNFFMTSKHPQAPLVTIKVARLRPQLMEKFTSLLKPSVGTLPNTLVHMDLWSENILFRMNAQDREDGVAMEEAELDCCLLDWQMISYGSPTHDLALLLMLSMEPSQRRENMTLLLKYYFEKFRTIASYFNLDVPFNIQMLKEEFKKSCVLATLMAMASIDIVMMEETTQFRLMEALTDLTEDKLL